MNIKIKLYTISLVLLTNAAFAQPELTISFPNEHSFLNLVAISDDGKMIATGRNEVAVWVAETGEKIIQFDPDSEDPRPSNVTSLSFSPDGKQLFVGEYWFNGKIWDIMTAQIILEVTSASIFEDIDPRSVVLGGITGADFTSDGAYLVTGDSNGFLQMWNAKTGDEINSTNIGEIKSIEISPQNDRIIAQKRSYAFEIDLNTFEQLRIIEARHIELSSNWDIALINLGQTNRLVNFKTDQIIKEFPLLEHSPLSVDLSPNGLFPIIGSISNGIEQNRRILSADSDVPIRTYEFSKDAPANSPTSQDWQVEFFPDGKCFLTVNGTNIHIWDVSDLSSSIQNSQTFDN